MAAGFTIDLDEVSTLVDTLDHAEERMTRANDRLRDVGPKDLGSPYIDQAAAEFQDDWEHGIEKIAELTGDITEGLRKAIKHYRELDESIKDAYSGGDPGVVSGTAATDQPYAWEIARRLAGED